MHWRDVSVRDKRFMRTQRCRWLGRVEFIKGDRLSATRFDELKRLLQYVDAATRAGTPFTVRRDGEARLANVVGQLNEVVTILKPDGAWEYTSEAGTRILGYPKGVDIEGGIFSLLHPTTSNSAWTSLAQVLEGTRSPDQSVDLRVRDVGGEYHIFETVGINLVDHPVIEGVLVIGRDVTTERRAAEHARETMTTLKALLASLRDGVMFLDNELTHRLHQSSRRRHA